MAALPNLEYELSASRQLEKPAINLLLTWISNYQPQPVEKPSVDFSQLTIQQKHIVDQVRNHLGKSPEEQFERPLRLLLYGPGGVGKSALIHHFRFLLDCHQRNNPGFGYVIAAFTGAAANLVHGTSLHSAFGIPLARIVNSKGEYILPPMSVNTKSRISRYKFIVLEEASLIGQKLFGLIDKIMRAADETRRHLPFAGRSVVIAGDLFQISPIADNFIFYPEDLKPVPCPASLYAYEVYREFQHGYLLNTPFRQAGKTKEFADYREFLERVKLYKSTEDDHKTLKTRLAYNLSREEVAEFDGALRAFPRRYQVAAYNRQQIRRVYPNPGQIICIPNGLDDLEIALGCPVMLLKNLSIKMGLVNSAVGTVVDYHYEQLWNRNNAYIECILVNFPGYKGTNLHRTTRGEGVPIYRYSFTVFSEADNDYISVYSFPLRLNYAQTVHSVQGRSLDRIVTRLDDTELSNGCDYVVYSRIPCLKKLLLMDDYLPLKRVVNPKRKNNAKIPLFEEKRILRMQVPMHAKNIATYLQGERPLGE